MTNIGETIRLLRKERGLTQHDLALQSGLSFSFINQVEGGKQSIRLDVLERLVDVFGYEVTIVKKRPGKLDERLRDEG